MPIISRNCSREVTRPETNLTEAADLEDGLPALQRLWDDSFGSFLKLCQDVVGDPPAAETTSLAA
jgi:hypothetical protein